MTLLLQRRRGRPGYNPLAASFLLFLGGNCQGQRLIAQQKQTNGLTFLPNNATMTSFYQVRWGLEAAPCDNHAMAIDLQCEGIILLMNESSTADCFYLTSNTALFNWIRCTSRLTSQISDIGNNYEGLASTRVRCIGNTLESHALFVQAAPLLNIPCQTAGAGTSRVLLHRLYPSILPTPEDDDSDNNTNIFKETIMDYTTETDWTQTTVPHGCLNSLKDNPAGEGMCFDVHAIFCFIYYAGGFPFLYCPRILSDSIFAVVWSAGIDTNYFLPATPTDSDLFAAAIRQDAIENMHLGSIHVPMTMNSSSLSTSTNTVTITEGSDGDVSLRATYKVYFDLLTNDSSSCLIPPPDLLLVCGSGSTPSFKAMNRATCINLYVARTGFYVSRCTTDTDPDGPYQSSVTVRCDGTTAAQRELFMFSRTTTLSQCLLDSSQKKTVSKYIWPSVLCGEELIWGEKQNCLAGTGGGLTPSGQDYCSSAFSGCGDDENILEEQQNCTAGLLAASVSAGGGDGSCLEPVPPPS